MVVIMIFKTQFLLVGSSAARVSKFNTCLHECAEALGLTVFTPENFKTPETVSIFASHQADLAVVKFLVYHGYMFLGDS